MLVGKITRLKLVVTARKYFIQLQARFSSRQEGTIIFDEIVTVVLSNKIFQWKQSSQFCISRNAKQQMESLSEQPVRLRFFKLCKNQSFETNRSDLHGVKNLVHTCMRWILIHLNSEFRRHVVLNTVGYAGETKWRKEIKLAKLLASDSLDVDVKSTIRQ